MSRVKGDKKKISGTTEEKSVKSAEIETPKPVTAISYDRNQAKITITGVPDRPGIASSIFKPLGDSGISVDMIVQNISQDGLTDITFTVKRQDLQKAISILEPIVQKMGFKDIKYDDKIAKVSIVGIGMRDRPGVAGKMFETLAKANINIEMISTSEIKISCVIKEKFVELAVRELHEAFELDK
ncbi:MAG: ACT domain-containing protein [Candidatus Calescibacterium sp.]|nr:ACT domain-containing protein [Candidatus Calescibacterium sp.]MCX7734664.1 ACT domain-containing protein [bacterium]MDW8087788.1 ACT domain-containing protein [Candidatus Calescibacterium sp.]